MCCSPWHFCCRSLLAIPRKKTGKPRKKIGNLNGFENKYLTGLKVPCYSTYPQLSITLISMGMTHVSVQSIYYHGIDLIPANAINTYVGMLGICFKIFLSAIYNLGRFLFCIGNVANLRFSALQKDNISWCIQGWQCTVQLGWKHLHGGALSWRGCWRGGREYW